MFVGVRFLRAIACSTACRSAVASTASRRRIDGVDGVEARARELRANNRVASTALASTPSHAMIQNEDAHPPRAQAHAARKR